MLTRHKLDVDDYFRMIDAGILGKEDWVELIDGEILDMAPISQAHAATVSALNQALVMACRDQAIVGPHNSVRLDRPNVLQPDFAILRPRPDFYATGARLALAAPDITVRLDLAFA